MTTTILLCAALLVAIGGLALAAIRIRQINRSLATLYPDGEKLKSAASCWAALGLTLALSASAVFLPGKPAAMPTSPQPAEQKETAALRNQIAQLKQQLAEAAKPQPPTPANPTPATDTPSPETTSRPEAATAALPGKEPVPPAPPVSPQVAQKTVDPHIEQLSGTVIQSLITGSTKSLATVADKTLLDLLNQQLTVNPFDYSNLQSGLKHRLRNGYTPSYLGALAVANGTVHLWKIKTATPGPDILEKLAVANGKITGFHFDGLR